MRSYYLFNEFLNRTIYGDNPAEALMSAGKLGRGVKIIDQKPVEQEPLVIENVEGRVDTKGITRGSKTFIRMIVKDNARRLIEVDMEEGPSLKGAYWSGGSE